VPTEYVELPITTDPDALAELAFESLTDDIPGWLPAAGAFDTIIIEKVAMLAAIAANLAAGMPVSGFRFLGRLVSILPTEATAATVDSTWTMVNDAGYTIDAGTVVGVRVAGDTLVPFEVANDTIITPGTTASADGAVLLRAKTPGAASSGLGQEGDAAELIDRLEYVASVTIAGTTTGGVDAETNTEYVNRLASRLQLLSDGLVLPSDFAIYAQSVPGVDRALALDGYNPNANEIQTITVNATDGTYTLTFDGQTTAAIDYDATAATVQAALQALSNVAPGDVIVTGGPGGTAALAVEFSGTYDGTDVAAMTADSGSLTGGTSTAAIATTRAGSDRTGNERMITVAVVDENGNEPSSGVLSTVTALLQAKREINFLVYVIGPTLTEIDVAFTVSILDGYLAADVIARTEQAVSDYLSPKNWGRPPIGDPRGWVAKANVRYLEVATVINNVPGVDEITSLTLGLHGDTLTAADVALTGAAPLPSPTDVTGTAA
jgi:hypothetical protein